jgi:WD40 repeat protein
MFRFIRTLGVLCLLVLAAVLLASCGASDDGKASTTGLVSPPTRTPAPDVTPTPEPVAALDPAPPPVTVTETQLGLGNARHLRWSADGTQLVVDGSLGTWVYRDLTGAAQPERVSVPWTGVPVISTDGRYAVADDADEVNQLWDVESGAVLFPLDSDDGAAWFFRFSADSAQIAAAISPPIDADSPTESYPGELPAKSNIRVWEIASGEFTDYAPPEDRLLDIGFDPAGHLIVVGSDNNIPRYQWAQSYQQPLEIPAESSDPAVRVWDVTADEQIAALDDLENPVTDANLSADAARMSGIVTVQTSQYGFTDWELHAWDIASGTQVFDEQLDPISPIDVRTFSPDGSTLAAVVGVRVQDDSGTYYTSNTHDQVWRWNLDTGDDLPPLTSDLLVTDSYAALVHIAYSPDGSHIAGLTRDGLIVVWDLAAPDAPQTELVHFMGSVESVAVSADGQTVYSGGADGSLRAWAANGDSADGTLLAHSAYPLQGLRSLPGDLLLVQEGYDYGRAFLWDMATESLVTRYTHSRGLPYTAFSPDGTLMASSSGGGTVNVWDVYNGSINTVILASQQVTGLAFSPDAALLATGGMDGTITLWDVRTGDEITTLRGHTGGVTHLAYRPDGALLSASLNGTTLANNFGETTAESIPDFTIRQWDVDAGTSDVLVEITPFAPPSDEYAASNGAEVPWLYLDPRTTVLSAGGAWLATIDRTGDAPVLRVWSVFDGAVVLEQPLDVVANDPLGGLPVSTLAFGPEDAANSNILLVGGRRDGLITVWRLVRAAPEAS